ncbi:MAG: inositol-phosphate phosphatase [Deltaproteobacteria bacterium]|nr:MAG: inositol-phosphate phosphatase [Deltaproteobacteria bacterium]
MPGNPRERSSRGANHHVAAPATQHRNEGFAAPPRAAILRATTVRYGERMEIPSLAALLPVVREAGELARGLFQNVTAERKADRTLVTAADRAVESYLVERLPEVAPGVRLLGEEFGAVGPDTAACTLTLDPIDGTSAFVAGLPTWCVTVGIICDGRAVGGITYLPMTGETYVAEHGEARWNGRALPRGRRPAHEGDLFIVTHSDLHRGRGIRFPGKVRALGSTAYHMALVARGAAVAALLGHARIWDIAAGAAMLDAVGGELRYRTGAAVDLRPLLGGERAPEHLVAAAPGMMDEILPQLQPR